MFMPNVKKKDCKIVCSRFLKHWENTVQNNNGSYFFIIRLYVNFIFLFLFLCILYIYIISICGFHLKFKKIINLKKSMQSMLLITWASIISKEQDRVLGNFKFHVDNPLKANLQFFDHFSAKMSFGHNHNLSMTNYSNLSIFSISRISLCSHHQPFF